MTLVDTRDPSFDTYCDEGVERAMALGNRGPISFTDDGDLHPDIVEAYGRCGFYVFEGVVADEELQELRVGIDAALERAPYPDRHSAVDRHGRPALGLDWALSPWTMAAPLSDPVGGTSANNGRHHIKMHEPEAPSDAPAHVPLLVGSGLRLSDAFLRVFGHPGLLRVAEHFNGPDFTPFTEVLFVKEPGLGPSVSWHQDGQLHWDSPQWDQNIHGFNFQVQLYGSTPRNGVWVVPGTHRLGRVDIAERMRANGGSDRWPDGVPLVCGPGDCTMTNRQTLHGSFPNTSNERRITVNFGFHRRSSVLGQRGVLSGTGNLYDEEYVRERCRTIPLAIDARAQRFPDEERYEYAPTVGEEGRHRYTPENAAAILTDYNTRDLGI